MYYASGGIAIGSAGQGRNMLDWIWPLGKDVDRGKVAMHRLCLKRFHEALVELIDGGEPAKIYLGTVAA